jgi:hypothetical protein
MMTSLVLFAFVSYGMTTIMVYGSIFESVRNFIHYKGEKNKVWKFFSDLISCVLCTSTWVGFFLSIAMFSPTQGIYNLGLPYHIFFDGMFSAGVVWSINAIIEWCEE